MNTIRQQFQSINIWKRGSQRAPHKPLLILLALGHYQRGGERLIPFEWINERLRKLLVDFGPYRKTYHPEFPFWRLQNDNLWEVTKSGILLDKAAGDNVSQHELLSNSATGGFPEALYQQLKKDAGLAREIARDILEMHFSETLHDDILQSVGLDLEMTTVRRRIRSPHFRNNILKAYEYRCAICGFDIRMAGSPVGLEAAHIQWHQHEGPDIEPNGLALCSLHHKLFDRGVFTLSPELEILVSEYASGGENFDFWLKRYHGHKILHPQRPDYYPDQKFVTWHVREVFRGPSRYLGSIK